MLMTDNYTFTTQDINLDGARAFIGPKYVECPLGSPIATWIEQMANETRMAVYTKQTGLVELRRIDTTSPWYIQEAYWEAVMKYGSYIRDCYKEIAEMLDAIEQIACEGPATRPLPWAGSDKYVYMWGMLEWGKGQGLITPSEYYEIRQILAREELA